MKEKKKKQNKRNRKNRKVVKGVVCVYLLIHTFFYLSGFFSETNKYIGSEFRTEQRLSNYKTISLIRWEYAPKEKTMEITIDLKNTMYSEGRVELSAKYEKSKNLDTQVVYSDQDMLVIRLYGMPYKIGKKITLNFAFTPEGEEEAKARFYEYIGGIEETDTLPILEKNEYYTKRQEYDMAYYQGLIDDLKEEIVKNQESIQKIELDIESIQNDTGNLTTDEMLNLNEIIQNDKNTIEMLKSGIEKNKEQISTYEETIEVLRQRMVNGI